LYIASGFQVLYSISPELTLLRLSSRRTVIQEAPFFKVADYGIVGDAFEIVPTN
jgi:hypothetical protein